MLTRRGMFGLLSAPAIVRASSLMRVVSVPDNMWVAAFQIDRSLPPMDQFRVLGWKTYYAEMEQALPNWTFSDITAFCHGRAG